MKSIIIIDDDAAIRDVYHLLFTNEGYKVTCFANEEPVLKSRFDEPDLFLIDKQLHGASGIDLCRFIRNRPHHQTTPVIIFSASARSELPAVHAGADAFLEKPVSNNTLLDLVKKIMLRHHG